MLPIPQLTQLESATPKAAKAVDSSETGSGAEGFSDVLDLQCQGEASRPEPAEAAHQAASEQPRQPGANPAQKNQDSNAANDQGSGIVMPGDPVAAVQKDLNGVIQQDVSDAAQHDPGDAVPQDVSDAIKQDLSDAVTIPPELIDQAMQQLHDGVPLEQVLENLREGLQTVAEATIPAVSGETYIPGMSVPAADSAVEISDEALLAQLGLREPLLPGGAPAAAVPQVVVAAKPGTTASMAATAQLPTADQTDQADVPADAEAAMDPELPDLPELSPKDGTLGKDKLLLASRISALEPTSTGASVTQAAPGTPLKALALPTAFNAIMPPLIQGEEAGEPLVIPQRIGEQGWGQNLAQRVMWMVGRDLQTAELKLNPANLGPLEIKLTMHQHDQASVTLLASNHAVRDALEQALPRLRDMLSQQDIQLVQADVGQRHEARQGGTGGQFDGQQAQTGNGGQHPVSTGVAADDIGPEDAMALRGQGLLDAYA